MDFMPAEIQRYVEEHTQPESDLLHRINRETHLHVLKPRMLSGHLQGRVLAMLSQMVRPRYILEIGTYTGYATLCLAEGLREDGKIVTIDNNEELQSRVMGYFRDSSFADQIDFRLGQAQDVIAGLDHPWDMVFIDADKANYTAYYRAVIDNVRSGGYVIADNVLWSGKVVNQDANDEDTQQIRAFNAMIREDKRVENVLLPVRDGLMIVRKL